MEVGVWPKMGIVALVPGTTQRRKYSNVCVPVMVLTNSNIATAVQRAKGVLHLIRRGVEGNRCGRSLARDDGVGAGRIPEHVVDDIALHFVGHGAAEGGVRLNGQVAIRNSRLASIGVRVRSSDHQSAVGTACFVEVGDRPDCAVCQRGGDGQIVRGWRIGGGEVAIGRRPRSGLLAKFQCAAADRRSGRRGRWECTVTVDGDIARKR